MDLEAGAATPSYNYDSLLGTSTSSSNAASFTSSEEYPVFPNPAYLSRFYLVSSQYSGLTDLDIDLYNECYLPARALSHHDPVKREDVTPKPTYLIDNPPCKRQAAINTNCRFQDTNGTFAGLEVSGDWEAQQQCYCETYPFFDSVLGCQECFEQHGGIEGYHWFPESYVSAVSSSYCNAKPQTTGFYDFALQFAKSDSAADVPTITASDVLGTQTAASLYYTYAAATDAGDSTKGSAPVTTRLSLWRVLLAAVPLSLMLYR
ncbi:hypothetical protein FE257_001533 [Aspergillus nanangensis]|uniref:Uncharacterized protein n=1 Tax=Aspergillus nanangensis TaxID=2582783 RepID=A0AAD4CTI4_ASPNN|nr:hypothetical protein FE257_001533 [Aspergillus nanangensis]